MWNIGVEALFAIAVVAICGALAVVSATCDVAPFVDCHEVCKPLAVKKYDRRAGVCECGMQEID